MIKIYDLTFRPNLTLQKNFGWPDLQFFVWPDLYLRQASGVYTVLPKKGINLLK